MKNKILIFLNKYQPPIWNAALCVVLIVMVGIPTMVFSFKENPQPTQISSQSYPDHLFDHTTFDVTAYTPTSERTLPIQFALGELPLPQEEAAIAYYRSAGVDFSGMSNAEILAYIRDRESGGNYGINTGNGYLGAYQFAAQYMEERYYRWGLDQLYGPYSQESFLNNPAAQDAAAEAYANERYGGVDNVNWTNGW